MNLMSAMRLYRRIPLLWAALCWLWMVAAFAEPSARQSTAFTYQPGGTVLVTNQITFTGDLLSLVWRPALPKGWTATAVTGGGTPELFGAAILFSGEKLTSPLDLIYTVQVGADASGPQDISAQVEYQTGDMVNPAQLAASPASLRLNSGNTALVSANHLSAATYQPGAKLAITNQFNFKQPLLSLLWRPVLPDGWTFISVSGAGGPELVGNEIVWGAVLPVSPIVMVYEVRVGNRMDGEALVRAEVEYQLAGAPNALGLGATPDPLRIPKTAAGSNLTHAGPKTYRADSTIQITNTFAYPDPLVSLLWRPQLPEGWVLTAASGVGNPELVGGEIIWPDVIPPSPLKMIYTVQIPAGQTGDKSIKAEVEYQTRDLSNPFVDFPAPDPISISLDTGPVKPPRFSSVQWVGGKPVLQIESLPAKPFQIQISTNLVNWAISVTTNSSTGTLQWIDPASFGQRRMYRVVVP